MNSCTESCIKPRAGGRTEHCTVCHQTFSSTIPGDLHRVGHHGVKEGPDRRRCLTVEEMRDLRTKAGKPRLKLTDRGVWVTWSDTPSPFAQHRRDHDDEKDQEHPSGPALCLPGLRTAPDPYRATPDDLRSS